MNRAAQITENTRTAVYRQLLSDFGVCLLKQQRLPIAKQSRMPITLVILLPAIDPLFPGQRHPREKQPPGIKYRQVVYRFTVELPRPELLAAVAEIVGNLAAVPLSRPDNQLMVRKFVAGRRRRQNRGHLLADEIHTG